MVFKSKASLKAHSDPSEKEASLPVSPKAKKPARPRSPARTKSPARTRSPARTKSPARKSPARTKTETSPPLQASTPKLPTPKARSPIRRSPGRKSPTRAVKTGSKSVETYLSEKVQRPKRHVELDSDSDTPLEQIVGKPQAAVRGRARRLEVQVEKLEIGASTASENRSFNVVKRFTRNSQNREVERIVHLKHFDNANVAKKLGEFSDEDDGSQMRKSVSLERGVDFQQVTEFGGTFGALFFTLFGPLAIIALHICCNEYQCSFLRLPDLRRYFLLSTWFNLTSALGYFGYVTLIAILSVIPFGGKIVSGMPTKQGKFDYIMNGFFSCIVLTAVMFGLEIQKIPVIDFIIDHLFHLLIVSILFGLIMAIYVYIRSFYVPFSALNAHVVGRSRIYGFFLGRELNPRIFGILDLKMYLYRICLIGSILLNFAYLYKNLSWNKPNDGIFDYKALNFNPTLLVLVLIQTIYFLDVLVAETAWVTSFEIQYEGFGFMSAMGHPIYPFMMTAITKYVVDYDVQLALWKLILISCTFSFGYLLFRGSNNQKNAFRKNPYDPALSYLETIPTTKGKKLICSGFWGIVRHPNYLGDILIHLSFAPFALCVPPVVSVLSIVILLIHRSVRDNVRCKQKYGAAWDRYCNKVKYVLIPKVY